VNAPIFFRMKENAFSFSSFFYLRIKYVVLEEHYTSYILTLYRLKLQLLFLQLIQKSKA
jgi:hypothetical protein